MMLDAVARNNTSHWTTVYRNQQETENGPMWDANMEPDLGSRYL